MRPIRMQEAQGESRGRASMCPPLGEEGVSQGTPARGLPSASGTIRGMSGLGRRKRRGGQRAVRG